MYDNDFYTEQYDEFKSSFEREREEKKEWNKKSIEEKILYLQDSYKSAVFSRQFLIAEYLKQRIKYYEKELEKNDIKKHSK